MKAVPEFGRSGFKLRGHGGDDGKGLGGQRRRPWWILKEYLLCREGGAHLSTSVRSERSEQVDCSTAVCDSGQVRGTLGVGV